MICKNRVKTSYIKEKLLTFFMKYIKMLIVNMIECKWQILKLLLFARGFKLG